MAINSNFSQIKVGSFFVTKDGEKYKKTSELTFDDSVGIERYIDPFFDKKIVVPAAPAAPAKPKRARKAKSSK